MSTTAETLTQIYEQVKNKDEWHQGALFSKDGARVCLVGRLYSINDLDKRAAAQNRLYQALGELNESVDLDTYNDTHTHSDVLQLVARAIVIEKRVINEQQKNSAATKIS